MDGQNMLSTHLDDELMKEFIEQSTLSPIAVTLNGFLENEDLDIAETQDDELIIADISKSSSQPNCSGIQISFGQLTDVNEAELRSLLSQWNLEHLAEVCIGIQFLLFCNRVVSFVTIVFYK